MSGDPSPDPLDDTVEPDDTTPAHVEELIEDLRELARAAPTADARDEIREIKALLAEAHDRGLIDSGIRRLRASDAAEAFVGSVIFASPLLVEDGVFDIAEYLFGFSVVGIPVFLLANTAFVVFMTYALVEWTGRNKEETQLVAGVLPARVGMILVVSFLVAALLMTVWGRVGGWAEPVQSIARINVIWTVGSLGAGLGDILSDGDESPVIADERAAGSSDAGTSADAEDITGPPSRRPPDGTKQLTDGALVRAIHERFDELQASTSDRDDRREVQRIQNRANQAAVDDVFGDRIRKYTGRDVAEAFVGSIFFSIPFLVEDGVFDVADYFLSFRIGAFPVFFLVNAAFVLLMVTALVYWAGPQDVGVSYPLFGFIPRRLVGIAVVSFVTAAALMTMWGRVGNWEDPVVAVARISAVWTVASFGAALGDILPGESSGDDINDDLADLGDRVGELLDQAD